MKRNLSLAELLSVGSLLFGLFFGAGNLIFPALMGQEAGRNVLPALVGFLVTGVGLPLLAVISLGATRSSGLLQLSQKVGGRYAYFFTCVLYLTIGPFFAIPRCFTVVFETGVAPLLAEGVSRPLALLLFSIAFFLIMLTLSLRPGKILLWIGKLLTPLFLLVFAGLMGAALLHPMGSASAVEPAAGYVSVPTIRGLLEGYNTMDALAGLAFGIVVIDVVSSLGVKDPADIASCTLRAGIFSGILMAVIYAATTLAGAQSRALYPLAVNGGEVLTLIARHYFGDGGAYLLALMIFFACIKTAIGLTTSCGEAFVQMFPGSLSYKRWTTLFALVSLAFANLGLNGIIQWSIPVLMMLYPLAITLILLALGQRFLPNPTLAYRLVTAFTFVCAAGDLLRTLPENVRLALGLSTVTDLFSRVLPFYELGMGWVIPALAGVLLSGFARAKD
ncbi:MAG: branched-chain amino acid transport system II carrier protein [Synergistaceae bacterium]|nr:branched-chain amino acid transport system II carrier protein [Synergistaceae bacterium]